MAVPELDEPPPRPRSHRRKARVYPRRARLLKRRRRRGARRARDYIVRRRVRARRSRRTHAQKRIAVLRARPGKRVWKAVGRVSEKRDICAVVLVPRRAARGDKPRRAGDDVVPGNARARPAGAGDGSAIRDRGFRVSRVVLGVRGDQRLDGRAVRADAHDGARRRERAPRRRRAGPVADVFSDVVRRGRERSSPRRRRRGLTPTACRRWVRR